MENNTEVAIKEVGNGLLPGNKIKVGDTPVKFDKVFMAKYMGVPNISDQNMAKILTKAYSEGLNPLTDFYVVAFKDNFDIIEKVENKLKRAMATGKFKGIRQGLYVINKEGQLEKRNNGIYLDGHDHELVGAWCEVDHADFGTICKDVNIKEYNKNKSTWASMKVTMILKVARGQALDLAFPNLFSGSYIEEEVENNPDAHIFKPEDGSTVIDVEINQEQSAELPGATETPETITVDNEPEEQPATAPEGAAF